MDFNINYISSSECPAPYDIQLYSNCLRCDYFQKLTIENNIIKVVCTYLDWNELYSTSYESRITE